MASASDETSSGGLFAASIALLMKCSTNNGMSNDRSDNGGTGESITIDDPQPGVYYVGVLAVSPYGGVTLSAE